jgi:hypothetical protein
MSNNKVFFKGCDNYNKNIILFTYILPFIQLLYLLKFYWLDTIFETVVHIEQFSVNLGPHDVKVQVKALGICGSDVHHFKVKCCLTSCLYSFFPFM